MPENLDISKTRNLDQAELNNLPIDPRDILLRYRRKESSNLEKYEYPPLSEEAKSFGENIRKKAGAEYLSIYLTHDNQNK